MAGLDREAGGLAVAKPRARSTSEATPSAPRLGTFTSFRYRPYRLWFAGQLLSQTGFWFYVVTQALLVLELTHSGTMVGIVTAVQNVPLLLLRGSSATFALLMAAMAAGSMGGAFWLARRRSVGGTLLARGACLYGTAQLCMAASPTVGLAAVTALFLGLGTTVLVNGGAADLQLRVDKGMRGRMMGLFTLAVLGGVGLGAPLSGLLAEALGTRVALAAGGVCALTSGLLVLWLLWLLRPTSERARRAPRR
jgi:MFS family permease